ncbi:MAG: hypothetical protein R3185_00865, partial [Candidatus Thermoplasmatota archaeon]|nr:hypothetical protein [Candidatus Thermoplasmatota archaeon]
AYQHRSSMKGTLAAAMIEMVGWQGDGLLVDPMAGGGTLGIEAAWWLHEVPPARLVFHELLLHRTPPLASKRWPRLVPDTPLPDHGWPCEDPHIVLSEIHEPHLPGAEENARKAGVHGCIRFEQGPVNTLADRVERCSALVANPPYGLRSSSPKEADQVLVDLFAQAQVCLEPEGKIGLMTPDLDLVTRRGGQAGFQVEQALPVHHGKLEIQLIVLVRDR